MPKRIFINNLNTYVAQAIFNELRNDIGEDGEKNEDANLIFGTFIDRDSSEKPDGITKMLKVRFHPEENRFSISNIQTNLCLEIKTQIDYEVSE